MAEDTSQGSLRSAEGLKQAPLRDSSGRFQAGRSANPGGRRKDATPPQAPGPSLEALARLDGWQNLYTGLGVLGRDKTQGSTFTPDMLTIAQAINLRRGDPLAARIVETLPTEALREGWELQIAEDKAAPEPRKNVRADAGDPKEIAERVTTKLEELGFDEALHRALCYERAEGGAAILLGVQDGATDLRTPLVLDSVTAFDWLTVLEPEDLQPLLYYADPSKPKYREPAVFQLHPIQNGQAVDVAKVPLSHQVHESRLILFPGVRVSERDQPGSAWGWGDSVLARCIRVLELFNAAYGGAGVLAAEFAPRLFKMHKLAEIIAADNTADFKARMLAFALGLSTVNMGLVDKEDEVVRQTTPVNGLPELLDRFMFLLSAAADMPATKLFGRAPAGQNATGEGDEKNWHKAVGGYQSRKVRRPIDRGVRLAMRSLGIVEPEHWMAKFRPLDQPSEQEQATTRKTQADADAVYIVNQVLSPEEVRANRFEGDEYSFATQVEKAELEPVPTDEERAALRDPAAGGADKPPAAVPGGSPTQAAAAGAPVQATAFNGSQIASAIDIVAKVNAEEIAPDSGIALLTTMFPITPEQAKAIIGTKLEKPAPPPMAAPFGGGPPKPGPGAPGAPGAPPPPDDADRDVKPDKMPPAP